MFSNKCLDKLIFGYRCVKCGKGQGVEGFDDFTCMNDRCRNYQKAVKKAR